MTNKKTDGISPNGAAFGAINKTDDGLGEKITQGLMENMSYIFSGVHKKSIPSGARIDFESSSVVRKLSDNSRTIIPEFLLTVSFSTTDENETQNRLDFIEMFDNVVNILNGQQADAVNKKLQLAPEFSLVHNLAPHKSLIGSHAWAGSQPD